MLSAYGWFDGSPGSGAANQPVQYSAFGAAVSEVELDVLTGERRVLRSSIMYDCGYPLNPGIDLGQVSTAFFVVVLLLVLWQLLCCIAAMQCDCIAGLVHRVRCTPSYCRCCGCMLRSIPAVEL
jgi:hypothetical protein